MNTSPWNVLHVLTNHEKRVAQHLAVRSLEHYLPLYAERSRWTDRIVNLERPLFAGYVFVRFAPEARISVLSTPGVLRLLGDKDHDRVSEAEIARIREGLAMGCLLRPHAGVAVGSLVRVLAGAFAGVEGIVTDFRQQCKVVMTLSATRQSFSLEVDLADVEVLGNSMVKQAVNLKRQVALNTV
ncbi:MAG: transcription termination/antitermination NusG family protein [Terracidiphilus sp.]|jgi:transcription antitermination factor NusG